MFGEEQLTKGVALKLRSWFQYFMELKMPGKWCISGYEY